MAEIRPFHAVRFADGAGDLRSLTCPAVFSGQEERAAFLARSLHNAVHLTVLCRTAVENTMHAWLEDGTLVRDIDPGFYLCKDEYQENGVMQSVTGLVCLTGSGGPRSASACPAPAFYTDEARVTDTRLEALASGRPRCGFSDGTVTRRMWLINDREAIRALCADFEDRTLYRTGGETELAVLINLESPGLRTLPDRVPLGADDLRTVREHGILFPGGAAHFFPGPAAGFVMALPSD